MHEIDWMTIEYDECEYYSRLWTCNDNDVKFWNFIILILCKSYCKLSEIQMVDCYGCIINHLITYMMLLCMVILVQRNYEFNV